MEKIKNGGINTLLIVWCSLHVKDEEVWMDSYGKLLLCEIYLLILVI